MKRSERNTEEGKRKNREYQKEWYLKNKEKQYSKTRERLRRLAKKLQDYKTTIKCERCGENHPSCMDFHHKDPSKKVIVVNEAVHKGWGWGKIKKEIDKCIVLCANCHRKEHWRN